MRAESFIPAKNTGEILGSGLGMRIAAKPLDVGARPLPDGVEMTVDPGRKVIVFTSRLMNDALEREASIHDAAGEIEAVLIEAGTYGMRIIGPAYVGDTFSYDDLDLERVKRKAERLFMAAPMSPDVLYADRDGVLTPERKWEFGLWSRIASSEGALVMAGVGSLLLTALSMFAAIAVFGVAPIFGLLAMPVVLLALFFAGLRFGRVRLGDPRLLDAKFFKDVMLGSRIGVSPLPDRTGDWDRFAMWEHADAFLNRFETVKDAMVLLPEDMFDLRAVQSRIA